MEHSPLKKLIVPPLSKKIPRILCSTRVYYRVFKDPILVPILNQKNPVQAFSSYFFKTHFNITFPSITTSYN